MAELIERCGRAFIEHGLDVERCACLEIVLEELAHNALEHGGARTVRIEWAADAFEGAGEVVLVDDGREFDPVRERPRARHGLKLARDLAGALRYERRAGRNRTSVRPGETPEP